MGNSKKVSFSTCVEKPTDDERAREVKIPTPIDSWIRFFFGSDKVVPAGIVDVLRAAAPEGGW